MPQLSDTEARAIGRAKRRLIPFLLLMYVLSYLDRANIGYAKQAYQAATGLTDAAFAFGAGIFFLTYAIFEIPSNLILYRVGARVWMARIMVVWGLVSAAMIFAKSDQSFSLVRLLLGAAEAGFFPGSILYLTFWFPASARGQVMGIFYFGAPLALMFGGVFLAISAFIAAALVIKLPASDVDGTRFHVSENAYQNGRHMTRLIPARTTRLDGAF